MRIGTFFKILTGFLAITSLPQRTYGTYASYSFSNMAPSCPNPINLPLPPGCEGYELLQGDPVQAMSFYLLEDHQICNLPRKECTTALLNQKFNHDRALSKAKSALVFEEAGVDQTVLCKDYEMDGLVEDCRGWNRPAKERSKITLEYNAIKTLISGLESSLAIIFQLPANQQKSQAIKIIKDYISGISEFLTAAKEEAKNHAENQAPNTYFFKSDGIIFNECQLKHLKILLKSMKKAKKFHEAFQDLETAYMDIREKTKKYIDNEENFIRVPNQFLLKTMQTIADQKKVGIAYVGRLHMHKPSLIEVGKGKVALNAVDELYEGLDKMADENPYAVLSCKNRF